MAEGTKYCVNCFDYTGCDEYIQSVKPIDGDTGYACHDAIGTAFKSFEVTLR